MPLTLLEQQLSPWNGGSQYRPAVPAPLAYSIAAAVQATGGAISRTRMFALIKSGELDARKSGRRTVIMADSLREFLERQPKVAA